MPQHAQPIAKAARSLRRKKKHTGEETGTPETIHASNAQLNNPAHVLSLQRTHGNQFVQRLLQKEKQTGAPQPLIQRNPQPGDDNFIGPLTEDQEKAAIVARIKKKYGIELDDNAGIVAVTKVYFKDQSLANRNPLGLAGQGWTLDQLRALEDALKHYAPILGAARMSSTLAGKTQGIKTFSRVDVGMDDETFGGSDMIDQLIAAGIPIGDIRIIGAMDDVTATGAGLDLGMRDAVRDALPNYDNRNTKVTAGTSAKSGYGDDDYVSQDPHTLGETFSGSKNISLYNSVVNYSNPISGNVADSLRKTIAHELAHALIQEHQLDDFVGKFSSYWVDRRTRVSGASKEAANTVEAPVSLYGATNAAEDMAEMAGYYFVRPDIMDNGNTNENPTKTKGKPGNPAPLRKQYMDRIVAEWTSQPIKTFGVKSDAVLKLTESVAMMALSTAHADALKAYKALSDEEKPKVKLQYDQMEAHYKALLAKKRPPVPTK